MSIIDETAKAAEVGDKNGLRDVLDFLVTEEQLGVTLVTAAIERAAGTPSETFLPVLRNGVTQEFHHVEALKAAGGTALTTSYWLPDAAFDDGNVGLFSTLEFIETVEISLYLIGVSAYARAGQEFGARLCAEAMGTEAVHRALVRFAQGELGKDVGVPNDVGFENFDGRRSRRSAMRSRASGSATARRRARRAGSTSIPAIRSPAASAPRSATRCPPDHAAIPSTRAGRLLYGRLVRRPGCAPRLSRGLERGPSRWRTAASAWKGASDLR
jgi:hypothetical protein